MQSNVCNVINGSKCHIYSVQKLSIAIAAGRNLAIFINIFTIMSYLIKSFVHDQFFAGVRGIPLIFNEPFHLNKLLGFFLTKNILLC